MADARCAFKYVKSGPGDLSGPSMMIQTERAINNICGLAYEGLDSSEEALSTAQQALTAAQNAQTAADNADAKAEQALAAAQTAQDTADTASTVANEALETAREAKSEADENSERLDELEATVEEQGEAIEAAQETADNALTQAETAQDGVNTNADDIAELDSTVSALSQELATLQQDVESCFTLDEETTDIDTLAGESVRLYLTQNCTTFPSGVSAPVWVWSYLRCDGEKSLMFLRDTDGNLYSRTGDYTAPVIADGSEDFSLSVPAVGDVTLSLVVEDGDLTAQSTVGDAVGNMYGDEGSGTVSMNMPYSGEFSEGDTITVGGTVVATYTDGEFVVAEDVVISGTECTLAPDTVSIDEDESTINVVFVMQWLDVSEAVSTWTAWTAIAGGGSSGSVSQAYTTLTEDIASGSQVSTQGVSYTPGSNRLFVYYEGVKLINGENFNEVDSSTIELLFDAGAGSTLEFVCI